MTTTPPLIPGTYRFVKTEWDLIDRLDRQIADHEIALDVALAMVAADVYNDVLAWRGCDVSDVGVVRWWLTPDTLYDPDAPGVRWAQIIAPSPRRTDGDWWLIAEIAPHGADWREPAIMNPLEEAR